MKLAPKEPSDAMMCQHDGYRNRKQRRKSYALELKAYGDRPEYRHDVVVRKAKAVLSTRQVKRVDRWFDQHWESIVDGTMVVPLPKNLARYYNAVINSYREAAIIYADQKVWQNAF